MLIIILYTCHPVGNIFYPYRLASDDPGFIKKWYSSFCLLVNRALSWWDSIMGGLNKYKLTLGKMHRYSLSHFHSICEGASHSNLIPFFLYQREGEEKKTTSCLILHEYICSVYIRVGTCVCVCLWVSQSATYSLILKAEDFFFFAFFPLDLFSNVDVYHLSRPAIHHPPFFVDNPKGSQFAKMWISIYFYLVLLPSLLLTLSLSSVICLFVLWRLRWETAEQHRVAVTG